MRTTIDQWVFDNTLRNLAVIREEELLRKLSRFSEARPKDADFLLEMWLSCQLAEVNHQLRVLMEDDDLLETSLVAMIAYNRLSKRRESL